ncbi:MAG: hypothetical protein R3B95_07825 [Nitrospirales bacterium]|nr:hypothetical protein [Nitrospirales bacterium]
MKSIKGNTLTEAERRDAMKPAIREALQEIEEAEMVPDHWGRAHSYFAVMDHRSPRPWVNSPWPCAGRWMGRGFNPVGKRSV